MSIENKKIFVSECDKYLRGNQNVDMEFIWNFIQKNHVFWIESFDLCKGINIVDGEMIFENLGEDHEYLISGLEKISYMCMKK